MKKITTPPVFSKTVDPTEYPIKLRSKLPADWKLSKHQLETYQALQEDVDVIINTGMTGDGKSLAGTLDAFTNSKPFIALYPTNELARDQELSMPETRDAWQSDLYGPQRISSQLLETLADKAERSKAELLVQKLKNSEIILTNPDIFHYLAQFYYTRKGDAPDAKFMRAIMGEFNQFIFDEFHIFQAPQIVSVLNAMLFMREVWGAQPKKFIFLSATPDHLLLSYLKKAGFRYRLIKGEYLHTLTDVDRQQWRPITRATDIHFVPSIQRGNLLDWVEKNIDTLKSFFEGERSENCAAKGAIIVNSVATAYKIAALLKAQLQNLDIQLNTGLSSDDAKKASREADILVGTSTVDVGVDFRINFLLFESLDAATFLQRLGRLGRHDTDSEGKRFETFVAYAHMPQFIYQRLFEGHGKEPALLLSEDINREELAEAIRIAYPATARFDGYAKQWGWVQSARVYYELQNPTIRQTYAQTVIPNLKERYYSTFGISISSKVKEYKELTKNCLQLRDEAASFRGSSPLQCGLVDHSSENGEIDYKVYSLLSIISSGRLRWFEKTSFEHRVQSNGLLPSRYTNLVAWFDFYGFEDDRRSIKINLTGGENLLKWGANQFDEPKVLKSLALEVDPLPDWLPQLNKKLRNKPVVALISKEHPAELKRMLRLPPLFALYEVTDAYENSGTIVFGRQALLLNVLMSRGRGHTSTGAIIC